MNVIVIERSKARFAAVGLMGLRVHIPHGHRYPSLVRIVFCQVEVSATGRSVVQRSPADFGVSK
jgi:hypothetical protein